MSRKLTPDSYKSKHLKRKASRKEVRKTTIPGAFRLFGQAIGLIRNHWEVFGGLLLIYGIINLALVGGINGGSDLQSIKGSVADTFTGKFSGLSTGVTLFTFLVSSGTGTMASGIASAYQSIILVVFSLALIWSMRQLYAGHKIRIRDGLYKGSQPLVPFILVLFCIGLQLLPAVLGSFLFASMITNGLLTVLWEQIILGTICFLLFSLSIYWICSSIFALYVVTLPDMTPLKALRSAKEITRFRRASILRKLLFLPIALTVLSGIIMIPLSLFVTVAAIPVFFILTVIGVGVVHSYLYALYRALIA